MALWSWTALYPVTVAQAVMPHMAMGGWGWTGCGLFLFFWLYEVTGAAPTAPLCSNVPPGCTRQPRLFRQRCCVAQCVLEHSVSTYMVSDTLYAAFTLSKTECDGGKSACS
jgi:hypothetical protein